MDNQNSGYRLAALVAGLALPFVNGLLSKFGITVTADQLTAAEMVAVAYLAQSMVNAIHARSTAAAAAKAPTPTAAAADLAKGPA